MTTERPSLTPRVTPHRICLIYRKEAESGVNAARNYSGHLDGEEKNHPEW